MKLLMITGLGSARDLASGKRGAFYNTLEEFSKYWDRIDIISPKILRGSTSRDLEVEPLFGNVYVHISPWPLVFHPFWFLKKGLEIYREQKFDLMTVHEFPPFYNGIGARLLWQIIRPVKSTGGGVKQFNRARVPYVMEIFHIPGYPRPASRKESMYKKMVKLFIRYDASKARAVRIMNRDAGWFLEKAGIPKEKLILIPAIYVDMEILKPMSLPKEYDLIFVGRLEKNKGIVELLKAVKLLKEHSNILQNVGMSIKLLIVGSGPLSASLKLKVKSLKLENNIIFYGWAKDQKEIAELLNKSRILVMPSYNEGGPRVVVEAMACGVPVLATPVGIVPDLLKNPPGGGQATPGGEIIDWNADDIAQKARKILGNYETYRNSGLEIVKQFEKKAAIKNYAEKLKELSTN